MSQKGVVIAETLYKSTCRLSVRRNKGENLHLKEGVTTEIVLKCTGAQEIRGAIRNISPSLHLPPSVTRDKIYHIRELLN